MTFKALLSTKSGETISTDLVDFSDADLMPGDVTVDHTAWPEHRPCAPMARKCGPNPKMGNMSRIPAGFSNAGYVEVKLLLNQTIVGNLCMELTPDM